MIPTTLWILLALGLHQSAAGDPCEVYVFKTHSWNHGYVAKLYVDQNKLGSSTISWKLAITFNETVGEFKIWDADIEGTSKNFVKDVPNVTVTNKCYNPILYSCQFLELSFLVRFPEGINDENWTGNDITKVVESVVYSDDSKETITYTTYCSGQPTTAPTATTTA